MPPALAARLTGAAQPLPDTDWHVEKLYAFARAAGATLVVATHSRYAIDLNRDPTGASLYPGADVTELCPTRTFANEPIWKPGVVPDAAEVAQRRAQLFDPYHAALAAEIERVRVRHGYARPARRPLDPLGGTAFLRRPAAGPEPRNGERSELRARSPGARDESAPCGAGFDARRQRPLQGRLRHASLRAARRGRPRAAARDRAGVLHGRGAAVPRGTPRAPGRSARSWPASPTRSSAGSRPRRRKMGA